MKIHLTEASNGGVINPGAGVYTLNILPNDNPHGSVSFAQQQFIIEEGDIDTTRFVQVNRMYVYFIPLSSLLNAHIHNNYIQVHNAHLYTVSTQ